MAENTLGCCKQFFATGLSKNLEYRRRRLTKLYQTIQKNEQAICEALEKDLGKSSYESYMTEIGVVLHEIRYMLNKLHVFSKPEYKKMFIGSMPGQNYIYKEPYGVVLIVSPWNYPFQLAFSPLVGAVAAGNCAVVKVSEYAPYTGSVVKKIINSVFSKGHVQAVEGDAQVSEELLEQAFDTIFFTGSTSVGKIVMKKAAKNLIPTTLELGGKSPCIVDETADIKQAAKRIVFGKLINAGQTCIAPDYVLVQNTRKEELAAELKQAVQNALGKEPLLNKNYPRIVNEKHLKRLEGLLKDQPVYTGGKTAENLKMEPTILLEPSKNSEVMQSEIFGPILPVIGYATLSDALQFVNSRPKPLALYIFSKSKTVQNKIIEACSFGGGCINDTIYHVLNPGLPFGGVGASGMGRYHGKYSFDTFTHEKTIYHKQGSFELPARYHPYTAFKKAIVRLGLR